MLPPSPAFSPSALSLLLTRISFPSLLPRSDHTHLSRSLRDLLANCSTEGGGSAGGDLACSAARKKGIGCVLATWERPSSTGAWCLGSFGQKHQVTYTNLGPRFDPKQPPSRPWRAEPGFQREQHSRQGLSNEEVLGCRGSEREQEGSPLWLPLSKGSHEAWRLSGAQPEVMCVIQCGSGFPGTQEKAQRDDSSQRTPRLLWIELSYLPMASLQLSGMYCLNLGSLLTPAL